MQPVTENKENITCGCLQHKDKIYPVYEGLNTIGRNPDAVVNIKNLNVSKYHAVITIVDNNTHYISDFKSSNGTILDNKKLIPLQLYKLGNGAAVKFGDVFCTYKKLDSQNICEKIAESQEVSGSFYATSTQEMVEQNVPEGINFNELQTQIFSPKELTINEMPTQVHDFGAMDDDSSDDSIDLVTMKKSTQSQMLLNKLNELDKAGPKLSPIKNVRSLVDSDTDDELVASSSAPSEICPVGLNKKKVLESETDEDLSQKIRPVTTKHKNVIESDSDTEEYEINKTNDSKSKYHISDDSETDIEDAAINDEENQNVNDGGSLLHEKSEECSVNSFRLVLSESVDEDKNEEIVKMHKKVIPKDHMYCQSFSETQDEFEQTQQIVCNSEQKETEKIDEKENVNNIEVSENTNNRKTDGEDRQTTSNPPLLSENNSNSQKTEQTSQREIVTKEPEVPNEVQTEGEKEETEESRKEIEEESTSQKTQDVFFQSSETLDFKDRPTTSSLPLLSENKSNSQKVEETSQTVIVTEEPEEPNKGEENEPKMPEKKIEESTNQKNLDDDICFQPTQTLDFCEEPGSLPANILESDKADEIFLQPTQLLTNSVLFNNDESVEDDAEKTTQTLEDLSVDDLEKSMEKISTDETPSSKEKMKTDKFEKKTIVNEASIVEEKSIDLLSPSQALQILHGEDPYPPSDKITEMEKSLTAKNDEDDLFLPPTQALEFLLSEEQPSDKKTEKIAPPSPFKSPSTIKTRTKKPLPEASPTLEDSDFLLPPTQALTAMHEDGTPFNKVEDELHQIFASQSLLCTQQLVDVLNTSKEEEIIDDSIIEERKCSFRKSEPLTAESIKEILSDELDKGSEELLLNKTSEKNEVKTYSRKKENVEEGERSRAEEISKTENITVTTESTACNKGERNQNDKIKSGTAVENENEGQNNSKNKGKRKQVLIPKKDELKKVEPESSKNENKQLAVKDREETAAKEETKKKGKKVENLPIPEDTDSKKKNSSDESKNDKNVQNTRNRRKQNLVLSDDSQNDKDETNENKNTQNISPKEEIQTPKKTSSRGRKKQDKVDESQKSEDTDSENNKIREAPVIDEIDRTVEEPGRRGRRIQDLNQPDESQSSENRKNKNENSQKEEADEEPKRRGRKKKIIPQADKESEINKNDKIEENEQVASKVEPKKRGRPKKDTSSSDGSQNSKKEDLKTDKKESNNEPVKVVEEPTRRGRRIGKNLQYFPISEERECVESSKVGSQSSSNNDEEEVKNKDQKAKEITRTTRSKKEDTPEIDSSKKPEPQSSRKRKKAPDSLAETPIKKKELSNDNETNLSKKAESSKKRTLKAIVSDSEDEFEPKVSPSGSTRSLRSARENIKDSLLNVESSPRKRGKSSQEVNDNDEPGDITIGFPKDKDKIVSSTPLTEPNKKTRRLSANSRRQKREEEIEKTKQNKSKASTSVLPTPERNRRVTKPKVVFTMMEDLELESLIRQLGGSVVETVDACTVLVTESVKRTQKLLCAVGQGKPICSPKWLQACKKAFAFVDPWDHVLVDKEAEKKWNFSLRESLKKASEGKLLENHTFQLIVNNAADVLKGAIESCGGKCVTRNLPKCESEHLVIVSSENNKTKYSKIVKQNPKIKVVEAEAIFDGALRQEFDFDRFSLT